MASGRIGQSLEKMARDYNTAARLEMQQVVFAVATDSRAYYQKVTSTWKHKPTFQVKSNFSNPRLYWAECRPLGANALIFAYVDLGTKAHEIKPKKAGGRLAFQKGYRARTAPIARYNVGSGKAYGKWVHAKKVHHPGTKARQFSTAYIHRLAPPFVNRIQAALERAGKRAWRS